MVQADPTSQILNALIQDDVKKLIVAFEHSTDCAMHKNGHERIWYWSQDLDIRVMRYLIEAPYRKLAFPAPSQLDMHTLVNELG